MVYPYFIYGGFTVDKYDGNYEDFSVGLIKDVSLIIFDMIRLRLADSSKLGEEIGCMEGASLGVSKRAIKGITEATILGRKEFCDKYIPLGIYEWILEEVKDVALIGLI